VRVEATYAHQLRKEIVPVFAEDSFTPTGWLGVLCAGVLYYELHDPQKFEDNMRKLCKRLKNVLDQIKQGTCS